MHYLYPVLTYNEAFYKMKLQLTPLYDEWEAAAIAHEVLHWLTGQDKMQRLMNKDAALTPEQEARYAAAAGYLLTGMPLQYVTNSAWFMGREYYVDNRVLIPRPETEELVDWVVKDAAQLSALKVLDIGTGSGCIPISLQFALPHAAVTSCDISAQALEVAARNAERLESNVTFRELDFLEYDTWDKLGTYDIVVSNPPYIPEREQENMHTNVKDFEPSVALFVPDDDALLFYRAIAEFGKKHLKEAGSIYCELEVTQAERCAELFREQGYAAVELRKDMHGNWRMLRANNFTT